MKINAKTERDYYEVLGINRDADTKTIKEAFRKLALQYHPDRNKEPDAEERFKEIAKSYAVLSDSKKRAQYDSGGFAGVAGFTAEDLFGGINLEDIFHGFDFDLGGNILDRFLRRRPEEPDRGSNLEVEIAVPLQRILDGGEETVRLARNKECEICHGSGAKPGTELTNCASCKGTGQYIETGSEKQGSILFKRITFCAACGGTGKVVQVLCPTCGGKRVIQNEETYKVKIPIGIEDGTVLRIPGAGSPSHDPKGTPGDLHVIVFTSPDPRFERSGADLWLTETISVSDAVLGTTIKVPTLKGDRKLKVPKGTQPYTVLRMHSEGLPLFGRKGQGDQLVRILVHIPEHLSKEQQALFKQLADCEKRPGKAQGNRT